MNNKNYRKRKRVFDRTKGKCYYCGCDINIKDFHMDHVRAKSKGGKGGKNLVPACSDCNEFKGDLDLEDFRAKIDGMYNKNITAKIMCKYGIVKKKRTIFYFEKNSLPENIC